MNSINLNQDVVRIPDRQLVVKAIFDVMPLSLAVIPWGMLCGSLAIEAGLTPLQAQFMSLIVFAGAAQLAGVSIISAGGSIVSLFTTTAVISSRHLLYSAVLKHEIRKLPLRWRAPLAFVLTDEMFAVAHAFREEHGYFSPLYALVAGIGFGVIWNVSTLVGIVAGASIPNLDSLGLEFAIAATFIALVIPAIKSKPVLMSVVVSGLTIIGCNLLSIGNSLMIAAFAGMTAGYITEQWGNES
ncbi:branched-chain amino acid ABC transporter permease [Endozoicomonas sp. OPT23]|nr:branched-chain amino acid ABC transporter permease [Endozoicomonas sp. OPT23]